MAIRSKKRRYDYYYLLFLKSKSNLSENFEWFNINETKITTENDYQKINMKM